MALSPNTVPPGVRASIHGFWGARISVLNRIPGCTWKMAHFLTSLVFDQVENHLNPFSLIRQIIK